MQSFCQSGNESDETASVRGRTVSAAFALIRLIRIRVSISCASFGILIIDIKFRRVSAISTGNSPRIWRDTTTRYHFIADRSTYIAYQLSQLCHQAKASSPHVSIKLVDNFSFRFSFTSFVLWKPHCVRNFAVKGWSYFFLVQVIFLGNIPVFFHVGGPHGCTDLVVYKDPRIVVPHMPVLSWLSSCAVCAGECWCPCSPCTFLLVMAHAETFAETFGHVSSRKVFSRSAYWFSRNHGGVWCQSHWEAQQLGWKPSHNFASKRIPFEYASSPLGLSMATQNGTPSTLNVSNSLLSTKETQKVSSHSSFWNTSTCKRFSDFTWCFTCSSPSLCHDESLC